jgi:geranylgeranyl pyrophosphate synthase
LATALELIRSDGALSRSREAVSARVRRCVHLASGLPAGAARDALVHIAEFIAERCGAEL